jgi:hypothetical protein
LSCRWSCCRNTRSSSGAWTRRWKESTRSTRLTTTVACSAGLSSLCQPRSRRWGTCWAGSCSLARPNTRCTPARVWAASASSAAVLSLLERTRPRVQTEASSEDSRQKIKMKLVKLIIILQTISFNGFLAVILVVVWTLAGGTRSQA